MSNLFEKGEAWEDDWEGMPEFEQQDLSPKKSISVHFANYDDMRKFAKLVSQTVTPETQSIWYPAAEIDRYANKCYVDADATKGENDESTLSGLCDLEGSVGVSDDCPQP